MTLEQKMELFIFLIKNQDVELYFFLRCNVTAIFRLLEFYENPQQIYELVQQLLQKFNE